MAEIYGRYLYTIPSSEKWELVGEWEYPGKTQEIMSHYTTSIVKVRGNYVGIYSGDVLGGCCFWPQGALLVRGVEGAYFNPITEDVYTINSDGSLRIIGRDGLITIAQQTPAEESFSDSWD
ncbi:hypothetical protein N789_05580 [Arenimonas oryziterrae DSM 21050 = YC6267]|uniref:Uncharacterized protein n=1 Tax=Arenimonas oryziterrae DSM 21050 = YC6267 TaxID=1121015 RepID=A0A091BA78_9GAMM|nr:hypothetical protein N789_05580 [Arenimonas oryziterrae DSM 21050 = YC6267]